MGEEKTVQQLEAEYKQLLQEKLDATRKEKEAQELAAIEQKKKAEYEEEFKKKYGLTSVSRLEDTSKPTTNMEAPTRTFEEFKANIVEKKRKQGKNMTGLPYTELVKTFTSAGAN